MLGFILSLPMIGMSYGMHEFTAKAFGFGAKTLAIVDNVDNAIINVSMIVALALAAQNAPEKN